MIQVTNSSNKWCDFYNRTYNRLDLIGAFGLRCGYSEFTTFTYQADFSDDTLTVSMRNLFRTYQSVSLVMVPEEEQHGNSERSDYREEYGKTEFYVFSEESPSGQLVPWMDYSAAYAAFMETHVQISETALQMISWGSVFQSTDSAATRAAKMARALLTSTQKFVIFE